tara:strand:- start:9056 stop:9427 length:372 start_codon:yes stop_codon:yes gene_type:complete
MSFYGDKAKLASRLLTKYGQDVFFRYDDDVVYDPVLMIETEKSVVELPAKAYPTKFSLVEVSNTILSGDIKLVCEKLSVMPAPNWTCILGGVNYKVVDSQSVGLTGGEVIHYVQLRSFTQALK